MAGAFLVLFWILVAIFADLLPLRDPLAQSGPDLLRPALYPAPDGGTFWLGTDDKGRDILSRLFYGSRLVLFWSGMALGVVVLLLNRSIGAGLIGNGAAVALAAACAAAQLVIAPRIEAVRASIGGPVDALALSDARRQLFGKLHGLSVLCLGVAGLAAFIALIVLARTLKALPPQTS